MIRFQWPISCYGLIKGGFPITGRTEPSIIKSKNIKNCIREAMGNYKVVFDSPMSSEDYIVQVSIDYDDHVYPQIIGYGRRTKDSVNVFINTSSRDDDGYTNIDPRFFSIVIWDV